ncbi:MAG: class I SAM-dependent methyltransferase [bacterium]
MIKDFDEIVKKYYPEFKDVGYFFKKYLEKYINSDSEILDIGCGRQAFGAEFYKKAKKRVGVDPDQEALNDNKLMDEKYCCDERNIPNSIGQFDVIIAQWVLEHMENPDKSFEEIERLAKPGGYFIFMTPNIYSPLILFSKICPIFLKKRFRGKLGIKEEDTYPTCYRANSAAKINQILIRNNFEKVELKKAGVLTYFGFNKIALLKKIFFDRTVGRLFGDLFKTHLTGVYRKK